jgi:hypothetical protein
MGQNPIEDLFLVRIFERDVCEHRTNLRHHYRGPVGVGGATRRYRVTSSAKIGATSNSCSSDPFSSCSHELRRAWSAICCSSSLEQIEHFFAHYKDLEPGKWVKIDHWGDKDEAERLISEAIARAKKKAEA